jgi:hypothetical protein
MRIALDLPAHGMNFGVTQPLMVQACARNKKVSIALMRSFSHITTYYREPLHFLNRN